MDSEGRWLTAGLVLFLALAPVPAEGWMVRVSGARLAGPIAADARGNVFSAIEIPGGRDGRAAAVVKLGRANGAERWRRPLHAPGRERNDFLYDLRATADGDVVAAGSLDDDGHATFFLARLAGRDGRVRWRRAVHGQQSRNYEQANALALDPSGDVVAAGILEGGTTAQYHSTNDFAVVKLAGNSGDERWRFTLNGSADGSDAARLVAVDSAGDVLAAGTVIDTTSAAMRDRWVVTVTKLAGTTGTLLWRRDLDDVRSVNAIVVDPLGDVLMATSAASETVGTQFTVLKLAGATGEPLWVAHLRSSDGHSDGASQVAMLPSGDVAALGGTTNADGVSSLAAVVLDGRTGAQRWHRPLEGSDGYAAGGPLAIDAQANVAVGGQVRNRGSCYDLVFARLGAATGQVLQLRTLDGTATASACEKPDCDIRACHGHTRAGIDQDTVTALTVDGLDRIVIAGVLYDGPDGQPHGVVGAAAPPP